MGLFTRNFDKPGPGVSPDAPRKKGAARLLAQAAQEWCKENALASLTVTCAPCDEGMYQALGFDTHLGKAFAHLG